MRTHSALSSRGCFRWSSGDIVFNEEPPTSDSPTNLKLKEFSETCSFLQLLRPLTKANPYFCVQLNNVGSSSIVSIGLSDSCYLGNTQLGNYNNTIGYQNHTGQCISHHCFKSHTDAPCFSSGDTVGVYLTHIGEVKSSILLYKNDKPVGTAYHYGEKAGEFFPTVSLEGGPIELTVHWHPHEVPSYSYMDYSLWIVSSGIEYNPEKRMYTNFQDTIQGLSTIQGYQPLSEGCNFYEVELIRGSLVTSSSASIIPCLVSSGSTDIEHSSSVLSSYIKFEVNPKEMHSGDHVGWRIYYPSKIQCGKVTKQPVVCCFTYNGAIQTSVCYVEPEGGYYPLVAFTSEYFALQPRCGASLPQPTSQSQWLDHINILQKLMLSEKQTRVILSNDLVNSDDMRVEVFDDRVTCTLVEDKIGVHSLQYHGALSSHDKSVFQVNIVKLSDDSNVCVGLASLSSSLHKYPGKWRGSLGYHSRDGKILYDGKIQANTAGHRFSEGDQVMIETCLLPTAGDEKVVVLVRIWKNRLPVALRYLEAQNFKDVCPTVSMFANGSRVVCNLITPNRIDQSPNFVVTDPRYWCLPETGEVIHNSTCVHVTSPVITVRCLVCPAALSREMQHFEITALENPSDDGVVPPMIALTTASPYDPPSESNFKLDILRFWPKNEDDESASSEEASTLVKKGDNMGWGVIFPDDSLSDEEEQIVLCYLTVNREVILTRALVQPPGGFFPTLVLPYGCNRVKFDFGALTISSHPFTRANVRRLYEEAKQALAAERCFKAAGKSLPYEHEKLDDLYKPLPMVKGGDNTPHNLGIHDYNMNFLTQTDVNHKDERKSKTCTIL